jgi:hypothetical protein
MEVLHPCSKEAANFNDCNYTTASASQIALDLGPRFYKCFGRTFNSHLPATDTQGMLATSALLAESNVGGDEFGGMEWKRLDVCLSDIARAGPVWQGTKLINFTF